MKTAKQVYTRFWRGSVVVASLALLAYVLYFHRLGTLLPGYSPAEVASYTSASDWHSILQDPINAPYKVPVWLGGAVAHHGLLVTRIVAASFGLLAVLLFFLIARLRYKYWVAFAGTVLFATSASFLHTTRLGTALVLQFGILALMWCVARYLAKPTQRRFTGYITAILFGLLCYTPGMIWMEIFGLALLLIELRRQGQRIPRVHTATWVLLFVAIITPLVYAITKDPHIGLSVIGLPSQLHTLSQIPQNLLHTVLSIGIHSSGSPSLWLGHMPLLNVIELTLVAIGAYVYFYQIRRRGSISSILLLGTVALVVLLASFAGGMSVLCVVPLLYLLAVSGLNNLLGQWLTVFPRNPIARISGIMIIGAMLFISVLYQMQAYFVAWPHNPSTRQEFNRSKP